MSLVRTFTDYTPAAREDDVPWTTVQIEEADTSTGPWTVIDTFALSPVDSDPAAPAERSFTTTAATKTVGWYRITFLDAGDGSDVLAPVPYPSASIPFATVADVETRLGRTLSSAENAAVGLLAELASQLIAGACDKAVSDLDASTTPILRIVCIEAVCRALRNPENVQTVNERLGQWAETRTYRDSSAAGGGGVYLSAVEEQLVRRAVFGQASGSAQVPSIWSCRSTLDPDWTPADDVYCP